MDTRRMSSLVGFCGVVMAAFSICVLVVNAVAEQPKPDFTGTWKMNPSKSRLARQHGGEGDVYKIKHSEPKVEMEHLFNGRTETYSYVTDGKEHTANRSGPDGEARAKTYWDGNVLVIEKLQSTGSGSSAWTSRFALSSDGMTLSVTHHVAKSPMSGDFVEEIVYDKE